MEQGHMTNQTTPTPFLSSYWLLYMECAVCGGGGCWLCKILSDFSMFWLC